MDPIQLCVEAVQKIEESLENIRTVLPHTEDQIGDILAYLQELEAMILNPPNEQE